MPGREVPEAVALRCFNASDADPDGEFDEAHDPETHLIPLAIEAAMMGSRPLTVFGQDFATDDGSCVRDYIHVADFERAMKRLNWAPRTSDFQTIVDTAVAWRLNRRLGGSAPLPAAA